MYKKTLFTFYGLSFFYNLGFSFFFATYSLFLLSRGLNYFELNLVNVFCMITAALLEIPTGSLADNYGRRKVIISSFFIWATSMLIYFLGSTLLVFIFAEMVAALGSALYSGAFDAWAIDELKQYNRNLNTKKLFANRAKLKNIAWIIGPIIGALVGGIDLALPWLLSSVSVFSLGFVSIFVIKETGFKVSNKPEDRIGIRQIIKDSIRFGLQNKAIFFLGLTMMLSAFAAMSFNMFWQPVANTVFKAPTALMGLIFATIAIFNLLGNIIADKLGDKKIKGRIILLATLLSFAVLGMLASQNIILPIAALAFFFHETARGVLIPSSESYLHDRVKSERRATVQSAVTMAQRLGGGLGMLISGLIAVRTTPQTAWLTVSVTLLLGAIGLIKVKNGE